MQAAQRIADFILRKVMEDKAMKAKQVISNLIKKNLEKGQSYALPKSVTITYKRYVGYNYDTHEHEYVDAKVALTTVYRTCKVGNVCFGEVYGINEWRLSELKDEDCERILELLSELS